VTSAQEKLDNAYLLELYQTGQFSNAAGYIKSANQDTVYSIQALNSLAYSYQMAGNYAEAEKTYLNLYEKDTTITTLINLASIYANRGNDLKAISFYSKVLELDSNNLTAYQRLSEIEINRKQIIQAYNYLLMANVINPSNPTVAYNLSMIAFTLKAYSKADSVLEKALEHDPENINLLYGKALCKDHLKEYDEAIKTCEYLLELGSDSLRIVPILAPIHFYNKDYKKTIELFNWLENNVIELNEGAMYYMAVSHWKTDEMKKGFDYIDAAINLSISPNTSRYYIEKADLQRDLQQNKAAIASYERSLVFKENPAVFYSLALLYDYKLDDKKNALKYYRRFLKDPPADINSEITDFAEARINDLNKE